ncbi:MAG: tetraacyldisaccharide 4'-kinase [Candidatus Omnitrophica bacterium]|nr:tetraacyldisaccharide 4'-kinase [Candidatus Omnitrophota bacterium]
MREHLYNLATDKYRGWKTLLPKAVLLVLSWLYAAGVGVLVFVRHSRRTRMRCKTVSVGNITLGGTGKTVLVEYIARFLQKHQRKVAVISRGYKKPSCAGGPLDYALMGDEPYMLEKKLQGVNILVDANRLRACAKAEAGGIDTVILDDGFQQWGLYKDLEIVVIDCAAPFGNRHVLPRGILREPLSALKRADIFELTKIDASAQVQAIEEFLARLKPQALVAKVVHQPVSVYRFSAAQESPASALSGKRAGIFCGIGDPASFERSCAGLGMQVVARRFFADHHCFSYQDLQEVALRASAEGAELLVTTEKDAARLQGLPGLGGLKIPLWVLRVELRFTENEEGFCARLRGIYPA